MQSVLVNLMGISGQASDALQSLGMSAYDDEGKFKGVHNVLEELKVKLSECTDEQRDAFIAMIGGKTQMDTLNAMLQATGDNYDGLKNKIDNCEGTAESMYNTMQNNGKGSMEAMKSAMEACGIAISDALAPALTSVMQKLTNFFTWFAKLSPETQKLIVSIGSLVVALTGGLVLFSKITIGIGTLITSVGKIKTLMTGIKIAESLSKITGLLTTLWGVLSPILIAVATNPITWIAIAVVGLVELYNHCEPFRNFVNELWEGIKQFGANLVAWFQQLPQNVANLWQSIQNTCSQWWNNVVQFFTQSIPNFIASIGQWFAELPSKIAYALGFALGSIIQWGADCLNWITTNVPQWIESIVNFFATLPEKIWNWLVNAYNKFMEWGSNLISWIGATIPSMISSIVTFFSELPSKIWQFLSDTWNKFVQWGGNMITTAKEKMSNCGTAIIDVFKNLPSKMLEIGKNIVNGIKEGIKWAWDSMTGWIGGLCNDFVAGVKDALDIHSPSRRFRDEVGKWIPRGIQVGVEQEFPNLNNSIKERLQNTVELSTGQVNGLYKITNDKTKQVNYEDKFYMLAEKLDKVVEAVDIKLDGDSIVKKTSKKMSNKIAYDSNRRKI